MISKPSGLTSKPIATKIIGAVTIDPSMRCDIREYTKRAIVKMMIPMRIKDGINNKLLLSMKSI
jgi:hypothetical protein